MVSFQAQHKNNFDALQSALENAIRKLNEGRNMVVTRTRLEWSDLTCPGCDQRYLTHIAPCVGFSGAFIDEEGDTKLVDLKCSCGLESQIEVTLCRVPSSSGCWGLCSFGGKDADLDPEGCTGISKIAKIDDQSVAVVVGGHKSVGDPTYELEFELTPEDDESYSAIAHELVCGCGYSGYWSGDDWSLTVEQSVDVPWVLDGRGAFDIDETAKAVVEAARAALLPYEKEVNNPGLKAEACQSLC
ncbi:MAG: hypothetical protein M0036_19035 [Desulfobacteraceae bacterium]|nr:hypothetical protein [Desulfobacteraceae bacterium]